MRRFASHGFTLVELLLVLVIMSCLLGMAAANFAGTFAGMELKKSADDMAFLMRYAQGRSVAQGAVVRLVFQNGFRQYRLQQRVDEEGQEGQFQDIAHRLGRPMVLPRSVRVYSETTEIKFYPDGTLDRVRIQLKAKGKQVTLSSMAQRGYVFVLDE